MTSSPETSRYRDFSQFFESIGLGLENFGLEKKSLYRSRKYLVSKKSLGIGLENIWSREKSRYQSPKFGSQKNLGIGLENLGFKKKSRYRSRKFGSQKKSHYWSPKIWSLKKVLVFHIFQNKK